MEENNRGVSDQRVHALRGQEINAV